MGAPDEVPVRMSLVNPEITRTPETRSLLRTPPKLMKNVRPLWNNGRLLARVAIYAMTTILLALVIPKRYEATTQLMPRENISSEAVALLETVKRYLASEGVRAERIFVAPHAVDNAFYSRFVPNSGKEAIRKKLGIHAGQNVVLYLGRLETVKGIRHLLEAFVASRLEDSVLVVAAGRERQALEQLVSSLRIDERVRFAGYVPVEETVAFCALASVVVFPSVTTSQPKEL